METPEAEALAASGSYEPMVIYQNDPVIRRVLDQMIHGFGDGVDYTDIANLLLHGGNGGPADRYMSLKDFASYAAARERVSEVYRDQDKWNRMALINIANSGRFAADRSIAEYAQNIWRVKRISHSNCKPINKVPGIDDSGDFLWFIFHSPFYSSQFFTLHSPISTLFPDNSEQVSQYNHIPAPPYISHRTATDQHHVRIRWCET